MPKANPIRVIVVDDTPLMRSGLSAFLLVLHEMQLVGEAADGEEALQLCELVEPDIVLMDIEMPRLDGLAATRLIRQRCPRARVILLTHFVEPQVLQAIQESGASTYLTKDICADDLAQAIRRVHAQDAAAFQEVERALHQPEFPELSEASSPGRPDLAQELAAAVKMQADILPAHAPSLHGWDIAARLEPARETSGDFFDFIPLSNGHLGIVVADVTDKGMGAALFMALCSTLIRTYAVQYPTLPGITISTVNDRILADTRGDMFVTAFYGVLDPITGRLRYVNAGHNPPILISFKKGKPVDRLGTTGMALGVQDKAHWSQKVARLGEGDLLVLYTDGVTDAQDRQGRFFGEERLLQLCRARQGRPAAEIQEDLLSEVHRFYGGAPLQDDIAIMVIARK
jgi:sigma-B regulation protein RsbU (phosphoserine phosphatase)